MHPARQAHGLADVGLVQRAAGVGAIGRGMWLAPALALGHGLTPCWKYDFGSGLSGRAHGGAAKSRLGLTAMARSCRLTGARAASLPAKGTPAARRHPSGN